MIFSSFRLRLALLSAALAGLALLAAGATAWILIRNIKLQRLDVEIATTADHAVTRPHRPQESLSDDGNPDILMRSISSVSARDVATLHQRTSGEIIFRSENWPAELDANALPWPRILAETVDTATVPANTNIPASVSSTAKPAAVAPVSESKSGTTPVLSPTAPEPAVVPPVLERLPQPFEPLDRPQGNPGNGPDDDTGNTPIRHPPPRLGPDGRPRPPPIRPDGRSGQPPTRTNGGFGYLFDSASPSTPDQTSLAQVATTLPPEGKSPSAPMVTESQRLADDPPQSVAMVGPPVVNLVTLSADGRQWRVALAVTLAERAAVGVDLRAIDNEMASYRNAFLVAMGFALLLIALSAWLISTRAMRPVRNLTAALRRVTIEGLDQRLSSAREDREFVQLIEVFNSMMERLERSFQQASRFSADAAHELRTPLTILQGELERAINQVEAGSPMQGVLTGILDEVRRLSTISRKLLLLSKADAGRLRLQLAPLDLSSLLNDLVDDIRMMAPQLAIHADISPDLVIDADTAMLKQILHNLISNAIKYNIDRDGWIRVTASRSSTAVMVVVSNSSYGIAIADREKIFERFFRGDRAHQRTTDGVGLGLSLAREIARAHGGDLFLQVGAGNQVYLQLTLPRVA